MKGGNITIIGNNIGVLDEHDRAIITYLQNDESMPFTQIANEMGITEGTTRRRVRQLSDDGVSFGCFDPITGTESPARPPGRVYFDLLIYCPQLFCGRTHIRSGRSYVPWEDCRAGSSKGTLP
jgi:hypothetical protein